MSESAQREAPADTTEGGAQDDAAEQTNTQTPAQEMRISEDLFLGAGVCQTSPQTLSAPLVLPDYVPLSITGPTVPSSQQDVGTELPFLQPSGVTQSELPWLDWRRDDVPIFGTNPTGGYVYTRPTHSSQRFPLQPPSIAGSAVLNASVPCLHQRMGLADGTSSVACSVCTSQGALRSRHRRDDLYRLSRSVWGGGSSVLGPRSVPSEMHWRLRSSEAPFSPDNVFGSDENFPCPFARSGEEQGLGLYSKYRGRIGVVRRVRKRIADVGGRVCQSFLVWVLFVAALAGMEGFKGKGGTSRSAEVEWSDSEADSEHEAHPKFSVLSFKG